MIKTYINIKEFYLEKGKASEAQRRATKKWEKNNPKRKRYLSYRSSARTFVRHWSTNEDLKELVEIFENENKGVKKHENLL